MTGRLQRKVAVITGASRGLGAEFARRYVEEGAFVVLVDIRAELGSGLASELGERAMFIEHDVTDADGWTGTIARAEARFGPVSILVNNAGVGFGCYESLESATPDAYSRCIATNQFSVFLGMKSVLPSMTKCGGGSIINVSSTAGLVGAAGVFPYVAAKFAVRGMTKAAALELAPKNIRVNAVFPGSIDTPAQREFLTEHSEVADKVLVGAIPMGRVGRVAECAGIVVFLGSDEASYCTGADFVVDGGLTAH